jgi:two-component system, LytTR family, response regulator
VTKRLGALLVDDERLARAELKTLLQPHPEIEVLGEASDVGDAGEKIEELRPDVLFLDIQMPGASGFELLEKVPAGVRVVFVSAYSEFALRAFEVNALDYLLKPVNPRRLAETVGRLLKKDGARAGERRTLHPNDPLIFPSAAAWQVVRVREIACIFAARDSSEVVTADGRRTIVTRSLKEWEELLPERHFMRIHRSTIVNVDAVERIEPWFNSAFRVHVKKLADPLVVSRRFATLLRENLV